MLSSFPCKDKQQGYCLPLWVKTLVCFCQRSVHSASLAVQCSSAKSVSDQSRAMSVITNTSSFSICVYLSEQFGNSRWYRLLRFKDLRFHGVWAQWSSWGEWGGADQSKARSCLHMTFATNPLLQPCDYDLNADSNLTLSQLMSSNGSAKRNAHHHIRIYIWITWGWSRM